MLTQSELKNKLTYNPETGLFGRKNKIAGSLRPNGYIQIGINKKLFRAHRLAFLYMTGEWPKSDVDHIDMDRKNNKWANLREADRKSVV